MKMESNISPHQRLLDEGYCIIRGMYSHTEMKELAEALEEVYQEGMKHPSSFRHGNLLFMLSEEEGGGRSVLQAHWSAWINKAVDNQRIDARLLEVLQPHVGSNVKTVINNIHFKPPESARTMFRFHQDHRFIMTDDSKDVACGREIVMGVAVDPQTEENGCLLVFPASHRRGYLALSDDGRPLQSGWTEDGELAAAGLDPRSVVACVADPGDVILWTTLTVHGSLPNRTTRQRRLIINNYVDAGTTDLGEWSFRNGVPAPLDGGPSMCGYADLRTRPEPHYLASVGSGASK